MTAAHGSQAIMDGGPRQFLELLLTGYTGVAACVVLNVCEYSLVRQIASTPGRVQS
jgi:hypothetical protein